MKRIWLRFTSGLHPIMHICLLLSAHFFCRIKLASFWVHMNVRPTCVIVVNLSCPYVLKDTTNNHAYGGIVVNINFPKLGFIGPVMESWMYMLSPLLPGEITWHCVYPIQTCNVLSMIFQDEIFYESIYVLFWYIMKYTDIVIVKGIFKYRYINNSVCIEFSIQDTIINATIEASD